MKYRPTPLNIISVAAIAFSIYAAIHDAATSRSEGWGFLILLFFLPSGVIGLFVDYFLQKSSRRYIWILIAESCLLGVLLLYYTWKGRTMNLIIPDDLEQPYIVTIYGIDSAPKLAKRLLSWSYENKVPRNGILLTSSDFDTGLQGTNFFTASGIDLQNAYASLDISVAYVRTGSIKCSDRAFKYQMYKLEDKRWTSSPLSRELDSLELVLTRYLCKK